MLKFRPAASFPTVPPPAFGQESRFLGRIPYPAPHHDLGRPNPHLSQTFDELLGWPPFMGDVLRLTFHGGTTYLGVRVGLQEKNKVISAIAWVLGVGNGLAALADIVSLIKRAAGTHPPPVPRVP